MTGSRLPPRHHRSAQKLPFAAVNRRGEPGYDPGLQRHHLLPRQALSWPGLGRLFEALGRKRIGFDDFRRNGLLLPARDDAAIRLGLPLHLGPHRDYNRMVIDRLGTIEAGWSRQRCRDEEIARTGALMRIALLQRALRRRILDARRPVRFNRSDPLGHGRDFAMLDRMAEELWAAAGD